MPFLILIYINFYELAFLVSCMLGRASVRVDSDKFLGLMFFSVHELILKLILFDSTYMVWLHEAFITYIALVQHFRMPASSFFQYA